MTDAPHQFHKSVLREYDIRGIIDETLREADAYAIGRAFGTIVGRESGKANPRVCVGYDGRLSSPMLEAAIVRGLVDAGADVERVGRGPTPMLYYATVSREADGGLMITGSHNPPNHNGFKMMIGRKPFYGAQIQALGRLAAAGDWASGKGRAVEVSLLDEYVARIASDRTETPLNVAWDAGNGAAGEAMEKLVAKLPGRHVLLFEKIDGTFPNHHPDPTEAHNLEDLQRVVREQKLDLGIAFDGDGDRIGAIDAEGRIVWGDQLLAILAREVLARRPGATIIADVKASQVLFDDVAAHGGKPMMWKTGHSLIKTKMAETGSPLAGEMSGHVFFADGYYGYDDALYAAVRLLKAVAGQGGSLARLKDGLPQMVNTPEMRFDCAEERKFEVVDEVKARLAAAGANVEAIDGVRVNTADGWWLLRASNTQAVLVARAEGRDQAAVDRLVAALAGELAKSGVELPKGPAKAGH